MLFRNPQPDVVMRLTDEPATDVQISALKRFGYQPDHPLSRAEAANLLMHYQHAQAAAHMPQAAPLSPHDPAYLRSAVEEAKQRFLHANGAVRDAEQQEYQTAVRIRQEFWTDTCREMTCMQLAWPEIQVWYQKQGCRFATPTREQTQEILDALDAAMPGWDRDHPELFYKTLELNFPQLLQSR